MLAAAEPGGLQRALADTFLPIAPTIQIVANGEHFKNTTSPSAATEPLDLVAWQHLGYGDTSTPSGYLSKRRHRELRRAIEGTPYMALWQAIDATPLRGKQIRFSGKVRTANHGLGRLWIRVERGNDVGFLDTMIERPKVSASWVDAAVVGPIAADATRIVFGVIKDGRGTVWYDDLQLDVRRDDARWSPVAIEDPGFEAGDPLVAWKPGHGRPSLDTIEGWSATLDRSAPASGRSCLRVEPTIKIEHDELFDATPGPSEVTDIDLGSGLRARVPLSLYSRNGHTLGDQSTPRTTSKQADINTFDPSVGIADVIVVWNVLEHFWPYWSVVSVDWQAELDAALTEALADKTVDQHLATLGHLSAALPDGHAWSRCLGTTESATQPFATDLIENEVVVTASDDASLHPGDVIVEIDGKSARQQLTEIQRGKSGSPQWRMRQALDELGAGPAGVDLRVRIRRGAAIRDVVLHRNVGGIPPIMKAQYEPLSRLDAGVYYIDLSRVTMEDLNLVMDKLAMAPGIVFDMRARPNNINDVLWHLLDHDIMSHAFSIAQIIRPDHTSRSFAWKLEPLPHQALSPRIAGRVAFITDAASVSYPETLLGLIRDFHLGEIVGSSTAGTNGDIAEITEPSGCKTVFTGLRTLREDGSQFHLLGIPPTIQASRTIEGVRAGRDELLEKALAYVRTGAR